MVEELKNWSKADYIREFRKMWNWIADETEKQEKIIDKDEYLQRRFQGYKNGDIYSDCFLCEYDDRCEKSGCESCPIDWGSKYENSCDETGTAFCDWMRTDFWQEAAKCARKIANLPEIKNI